MLDIILEYRKGVLFVRLIGELSKNTSLIFYNKVIDVIKNNGINNVVLNLEYLKLIDYKGINLILYCYELCKSNLGTTMICNIVNLDTKNRLNSCGILNYIKEFNSELDVLKTIEI